MTDEVYVDLTGYKDRVGQRVAPGRYRVIVEDSELDKSQAGNQMINLWLRVVGGPFDGATIVDRLTLTDKALFRVVGFMQAIGLPTPKRRLRLNLRQFANKVLEIDVEDGEPYMGRVRSEVRGYFKIEGPANSTGTGGVADLPEMTEEDIAAGVAANATPENPGIGGLNEFAKPQVPGDQPSSDRTPPPPPVRETRPVEQRVTVPDVPEDVNLDELDLG